MKPCSYCGRENSDEAVFCHECGTAEFRVGSTEIPASPAPVEPRLVSRHKGLAIGFLVIGFAVSVALLGLVGMANAFSGWGDGFTVRSVASPIRVVIPYSLYFLA